MKSLRVLALLLCLTGGAYAADQETIVKVLPGSDPVPQDLMALILKSSNDQCNAKYGTYAEAMTVFYKAATQEARVSVRCANPKPQGKQGFSI